MTVAPFVVEAGEALVCVFDEAAFTWETTLLSREAGCIIAVSTVVAIKLTIETKARKRKASVCSIVSGSVVRVE